MSEVETLREALKAALLREHELACDLRRLQEEDGLDERDDPTFEAGKWVEIVDPALEAQGIRAKANMTGIVAQRKGNSMYVELSLEMALISTRSKNAGLTVAPSSSGHLYANLHRLSQAFGDLAESIRKVNLQPALRQSVSATREEKGGSA